MLWYQCRGYIFVSYKLSIDSAEEYCRDVFGTTLASIHSEYENELALRQCNISTKISGCSIGLNDKENERYNNRSLWKWTDESVYNYSNWRTGEPNEWSGFIKGEDCVILSKNGIYHGLWNDCPCQGI